MDRTELVFALTGMTIGVLVVPVGLSEVFEKVFAGGFVLLMVIGFASVYLVLHRLRADHLKIYNEIGATNEDLSWGIGDAFRRFKKFVHSSRHKELDDNLLSTAVIVARVTWRISFALAGFLSVFAVRSLSG
jgi:hypothetical protein